MAVGSWLMAAMVIWRTYENSVFGQTNAAICDQRSAIFLGVILILPVTAKTNKAGYLEIGGCDTVELAQRFGTPLFILDQETVLSQCRRYQQEFSNGPVDVEIIYAAKAFLCLAFARLIADTGLSIDVSSGGELFSVLKAAFPVDRVYLHGNNKTPDELKMALENNVGNIVVDSFDELRALDESAGKARKRPRIFLRLTPGVRPRTHSYIQTGQIDSKFGFRIDGGLARKAVDLSLGASNLQLVGFHMHIGSQIFALEAYRKSVETLIDFTAQIHQAIGFMPEKLNLGGGLGIKYRLEDEPASIEDFAKIIFSAAVEASQNFSIRLPALAIEPGRSIVGRAGVTLYKIGTIKEIPGVRTYVSVDGGMSDNLRPMLYGAGYEALVANKVDEKPAEVVTVAGKHCESGDILIKDVKLPKVEVGDILCTPATGAYGYMMANNFNLQPRPAVVLVKDGQAKTIIRRESYENMVHNQLPLDS